MEQLSYSVYRTTIDQVMSGREKLPSLPVITLKIRHAVADPDITICQLADIIGHDPSLTVMLMRTACSPLYRTQQTPKSLKSAISLLGIDCIDQLVMLHSVKSLFVMHDAKLKKLFNLTWQRQILKAVTSRFLAQKLGFNPPDRALIACLLTEIGTLAILSALTEAKLVPSQQVYLQLCRQYSKSLGAIILKKWSLDNSYAEILRDCGDWTQSSGEALNILDIINLSLYNTVAMVKKEHSLPDIHELPAYKKLTAPFNRCDDKGRLFLISSHRQEIYDAAKAFC